MVSIQGGKVEIDGKEAVLPVKHLKDLVVEKRNLKVYLTTVAGLEVRPILPST